MSKTIGDKVEMHLGLFRRCRVDYQAQAFSLINAIASLDKAVSMYAASILSAFGQKGARVALRYRQ